MKHISAVSRLPLVANELKATDGIDVGGIIKGAGMAIGAIIIAAAAAKALPNILNPST